MLASWSIVGFAVWKCQFHPRQRVILQGQKIDKITDLLKGKGNPGYARTLIERQTPWLRKRFPFYTTLWKCLRRCSPGKRFDLAGSAIRPGPDPALPSVRADHHEAAFLDDFEQTYAAADPVCNQIIAVSSANAGFFGDVCMQALEASE
jgi:hypothetical protein